MMRKHGIHFAAFTLGDVMRVVSRWTWISILAVVGACNSDVIETDFCPDDPNKTAPGICGCGVSDVDEDGNVNTSCLNVIIPNVDLCPNDPNKTQPGLCGCGQSDFQPDGNVRTDCTGRDLCPDDPEKREPGLCGCGVPDTDSDEDGVPDCKDECSADPDKIKPGICGCLKPDTLEAIQDSDGDTVIDCLDGCPLNADKTEEGAFGCDVLDSDGDGVKDGEDGCPYNPNIKKLEEGADKSACNFVDEGGKRVFQVWSAGDFKTLQAEIDKMLPEAPLNMMCNPDNMGENTVCIDENHRLSCIHDEFLNIDTYQATGCTRCAREELPPEEGQEEPTLGDYKCSIDPAGGNFESIHMYQQCNEKMPLFCTAAPEGTTEPATQLYCNQGMVDRKVCYERCEGNVCTECIGTQTTTGTIENQCCSADSYQEQCRGTRAIRCIGGRVQNVDCMNDCESSFGGDLSVRCITADHLPAPVFTVKLMNDIDLASAYPKTVYDSCIVNWTPLNLYRIAFDGNGKQITAIHSVDKSTCAIARPLFENVVDSSVSNLTLKYDLIGQPSGSLATWAYHSEIENVEWNANARITNPFFGEKYNGFGGLVSMARLTHFSNDKVKSKITVESPNYQAAGFIYKADQIIVKDTAVEPPFFKCSAKDCSGVFDSLAGNNHIVNLKTDFGQFVYGIGEGLASGFARILGPNTVVDGLHHQIDLVNQNYGTDGPFYGLTQLPTAQFNDLSVTIVKGDIYGVFTGISETVARLTGKLTANIGSVKSGKQISGIGKIADAQELSKCEINVTSIEGTTVYGIGETMNGKLNGCTIHVDAAKGTDVFGITGSSIETSDYTKNEIVVKSVVGEESASGIGSILGAFQSNQISIGSVQSNNGAAFGFGESFAVALQEQHPVNAFDIQSVSGKQAFGFASAITSIAPDDTFEIGKVQAEENAYGIAKDINAPRFNATFHIHEVSSTTANVYGMAENVVGGAAPGTSDKYTVSIDELNSDAGFVCCMANQIQTDFDNVQVSSVKAAKDIYGVFGSGNAINAQNLSLHVKDAKSTEGSVLLIGGELQAYATNLSHNFSFVTVFFDNAEGYLVMPFSHFNNITNGIHVYLDNLAIYTNARYSKPIEYDDEHNVIAPSPAILFANKANTQNGALHFSNIAVSTNLSYCPENKCAPASDYSFILEPQASMDFKYVYWYMRGEEGIKPELQGVSPFNASSLDTPMAQFGDKWYRRKVTENDREIEIPWLKDYVDRQEP